VIQTPYDQTLHIEDDLGWGITSRVYAVRKGSDLFALKICTDSLPNLESEYLVLKALEKKKVSYITKANGMSDDKKQLLLSPVGIPVFKPIITREHAIQFVETMRAIHQCGYLHHDVRPENLVLVTRSQLVGPRKPKVVYDVFVVI